jgi:Arc/MetJ-type ribon-helix-helix transcriptional regulator
MQTNKVRGTIPIGTRITEAMQKGIDRVLATDGHVNTADYVRDLIRKDLEKRGLLTEPIPAQ